MAPKTKRRDPFASLHGPSVTLPAFGTGEAAKVLGIPIWRLQNFLSSRQYRLSPSGQLGKGRGSRQMFRTEDLYRLAIAAFLVRDGFTPKLVSTVLQAIEDSDLIDFDERGQVPPPVVAFRRGTEGAKVEFFPSGQPPAMKAGGPIYYALEMDKIIDEIDRRIEAFERGKSER